MSTPWSHIGWQLGQAFPMKVLACMLRDTTFLRETFDCLDPLYFTREDCSILSSIILEYFRSKGTFPHRSDLSILIFDKSKVIDPDGSLGRVGILNQLLNQIYDIDIHDVQLIKDKVRDFGRLQSVARAIQKSIGLLESTNPSNPSDDPLEKIQKVLNESFQVGTDKKSGTFFNKVALDTPRILMEDAMYGRDSKVPTGIPLLDKILDGGPGAGTMNVIMAPPNRGKTTFLSYLGVQGSLYFASKALTTGVKKAVIHITLEMTEPDIQAKYASGLSGIDLDMLTKDKSFRDIMKKRLEAAGPVFIKFYPPGSYTVDDIHWYISNLVTVHGITPGLIIIDYADMLRGMEDDRFVGMGVIYKHLISTGHKFGCPVWNGCQINRDETKKKRHGVTGAAESWKKVEISDNILILNQTEEEHENGLMAIGLGKLRRGSRKFGTINCKVDYGKVLVKQIEERTPVNSEYAGSMTPVSSVPEIPLVSVDENLLNQVIGGETQ